MGGRRATEEGGELLDKGRADARKEGIVRREQIRPCKTFCPGLRTFMYEHVSAPSVR